MVTETEMKADLDGHFYKMCYSNQGCKVLDLLKGDRLEGDDDDELPSDVISTRKYTAPHSIKWTDKDQIILDMRRKGTQFTEIARVLGVNKATVAWRFNRLCDVMGVDPDVEGPWFRKWSLDIEAEVVKLRDAGCTFKSIGERYGMSRASACKLYYRAYRRMNRREAA